MRGLLEVAHDLFSCRGIGIVSAHRRGEQAGDHEAMMATGKPWWIIVPVRTRVMTRGAQKRQPGTMFEGGYKRASHQDRDDRGRQAKK